MLSIKSLTHLIDRGFLVKLLYLALLFSLVPVGEIALLLYLKSYLGIYMLLAIVLITGLVGMLIAWRQIARALHAIRRQVAAGEYPRDGFASLAGSLFAALLLIIPGFITDGLGVLLIFGVLRRGVGRIVASKHEERLKELYEYMKL
jgi:UPF0716 protein FxsA